MNEDVYLRDVREIFTHELLTQIAEIEKRVGGLTKEEQGDLIKRGCREFNPSWVEFCNEYVYEPHVILRPSTSTMLGLY